MSCVPKCAGIIFDSAALRALLASLCAVVAIGCPVPDRSFAQGILPQGGTVVSGQAKIGTPSGGALTVTQSSSKAVIDWNSFSVGQADKLTFLQPGPSSAILNRVTGTTTSTIAGQISANGQVFLVNPNGIAITPSGSVQVGGGFVASTLDIRNADFNAGQLNFFGNGASASVSNAGAISAGSGGFVGLIGGSVSNSGTIAVPFGRVGVGSGERVTIDPAGDGFLQVAMPTNAVAADGRALVDVAGDITATGGLIAIKAATAQQAVRDAVNVSGALSARSVAGRSGNIVLGGDAGGNVVVSGKLSAAGDRHQKGGSITVTGRNIGLKGAIIDVSGGTGGGTVQIGGGSKGTGPLLRAETTTVDQGTRIDADALISGNGGDVTVWSEKTTTYAGYITARGGAQGGNGGDAEVSGKTTLHLTGDYTAAPLADLSAAKGRAGTILFDPGTVNIIDQTTLSGNQALNGPDTFTAQFLSGQLASANVTIDTNNATGANGTAGDINLLSGVQIAWSSGNRLTLNAARDINFAAGSSINGSGSGASLVLRADSGGSGTGTVNFAGGTQVSLPSGTVDIYFNPASNRTAANGGTNPAAGSVNPTSYTGTPAAENWSSFVNSGALKSWQLVNNVSDLQNINNNPGANYALGTDINASATAGWNAGAGFVPLGTDGNGLLLLGSGFTGSFDGLGHVISNLTVSRGLASYVGLFGYINGGSVSNVGLTNVSMTGASNTGGLAGVNAGQITGSYVAGGSVSNLLSNGGGLVGWNAAGGSISNSYATNSASALVSIAGGLVGANDGSIASSYATGATSTLLFGGGLVGTTSLSGSISQSYFDTQSTGQLFGVGLGSQAGVTGLTTATLQNGSLPAGLSPAVWTATAGQYPQLNWQIPGPAPPATTTVVITATDTTSGNPLYGTTTPTFTYKVTDAFGNVLCTTDCSAYFTGTPLIDTTLSSSSAAGTSATGYIAHGTMAAQSGYALQFVNEMLSVAPRPLTITASDQSKTYGSVAALGTSAFTTSGLVNGDVVTGVTLASAGVGASASVAGGPYAITASAAIGTGLSNYTVGYADGVLTVTPAQVNVTALGGSSTYGSSPANPGLSATGLQNGESISVLTGLSNSFGVNNFSNAGNYSLTVAGSLTNANYTVANTTAGSWTVNPAPVTVTALGGTSTYGASPSNPGLSATGLQNGESVSALTGLSNSFGITSGSSLGSYQLNVTGSLTNANYVVTSTNSGTWLVTPLRGSVTDGLPSNPGISVTGPPVGQGIGGVLDGVGNTSGGVNTGNSGGAQIGGANPPTQPGAPPAGRPATASPSAETTPPGPASAPVDANQNAVQFAGEYPFMSSLTTSCPDAKRDGSASGALAPAAGDPFGGQATSCAMPSKPKGLIDFALSKLNKGALFEAIDREFSELMSTKTTANPTLTKIVAGTSIAVTAGFVTWILQSGALLNAIASSMPLWRGFDPLAVVLRPRRRKKERQPPSHVDRMFDGAGGYRYPVGGLDR